MVNDFLILMKISQLARAALVVILVVAVLCSVDMVQGTVMETTNVLATSNVALTTAKCLQKMIWVLISQTIAVMIQQTRKKLSLTECGYFSRI